MACRLSVLVFLVRFVRPGVIQGRTCLVSHRHSRKKIAISAGGRRVQPFLVCWQHVQGGRNTREESGHRGSHRRYARRIVNERHQFLQQPLSVIKSVHLKPSPNLIGLGGHVHSCTRMLGPPVERPSRRGVRDGLISCRGHLTPPCSCC